MSSWNRNGFFHHWNETFCFKWKRAHGHLFHRSIFPNATCFISCVVRWPYSGWRWQWNTTAHTCLRARAVKLPHGRGSEYSHQPSSAVPSKCTYHGSRLQDFWQWEINNWCGEKPGTVQLFDWLISIWVRALTDPMHLGLV
jgi:hypothetical protein